MTTNTISGVNWSVLFVAVILAVLSIILLSGRGSFLIAGYNTASEAEKKKYNEKMLCRITGAGMAFIALLLVAMAIWLRVLPPYFSYVFIGVVLLDCALVIFLSNTVCKNK